MFGPVTFAETTPAMTGTPSWTPAPGTVDFSGSGISLDSFAGLPAFMKLQYDSQSTLNPGFSGFVDMPALPFTIIAGGTFTSGNTADIVLRYVSLHTGTPGIAASYHWVMP